MCGFLLRTLPVCWLAFATGCFLMNNSNPTGKPTAPRTETHAYWQKVNETFARQSAGNDMKSLVQLVREQTETLRGLPTDGVDADLVAAVGEVVKCEEEVLWRAEAAGNDTEILRRSKEMAETFGESNRKAAAAKQKVKALRELMDSRYGGGFAAMAGEKDQKKQPPQRRF